MFDLSQFRAKVVAPQRSNKYSLYVYGREGLEDMHFLAEEVTFPTFGYDKLSSVYRYGYGVKDAFPGAPEYKDLIVTFIMQQGSVEHNAMHNWLDQIVRKNPPESGGLNTLDTTSYTLAYKDDYVTTVELKLHNDSPTGTEAYWEFKDVFPISVTGESMSWEQEEGYLTFTVTFNYYAQRFVPGTLPVATRPETPVRPDAAPPLSPLTGELSGAPDMFGPDSIFGPSTPPRI